MFNLSRVGIIDVQRTQKTFRDRLQRTYQKNIQNLHGNQEHCFPKQAKNSGNVTVKKIGRQIEENAG